MTGSNKRAAPATVGRRAAIAGAGALLAFPVLHARAQTAGVALVIGNSKYQWESPLPNVRRDAPDIAKRFQAFGLQTELVQDAGQAAMRQAIAKFLAQTKGASLAAFYFAGHGVTADASTFIVPVDADLSNAGNVGNLIQMPPVTNGMSGAANRLIVMDNCRNNPADGWRQRYAEQSAASQKSEAGFRDTDPPNTLALFSTAPGRVALDGPAGQNSPFASALLRQFAGGSVDLASLPAKLRRDLLIATEARQVLWDRNNFQQPFVLNGPRSAGSQAGGWGNDPSRLIELNNAYAFAAQNSLPMPPGLLAHRAPAGSRDGQKVGSFRFVGANQDPSILVVMSVDEQQSAELIMVYRDNQRRAKWRFLRGTLSGDSIDFMRPEGSVRMGFKWSDANSGWVSMLADGGRGQGKMGNQAFTRLDG